MQYAIAHLDPNEDNPSMEAVSYTHLFQRTAMIYGKGMPLWGIWM